jgi:hydroxymethylglutaryl-CoA reductase
MTGSKFHANVSSGSAAIVAAQQEEPARERRFRELSTSERFDWLEKRGLSKEGRAALEEKLKAGTGHGVDLENHATYLMMSCGILPQITVNGVPRAIPMMTEEPSVIAGVSGGAKIAEKHGGFKSTTSRLTTAGQVQIIDVPQDQAELLVGRIREAIPALMSIANSVREHTKVLAIMPKVIETRTGTQIIVDYEADCGEAMGAAAVSFIGEVMRPKLKEITGCDASVAILSNLPLGRVVVCEATLDTEALASWRPVNGEKVPMSGEEVAKRIVHLSAWSEADLFRAVTHNKGIMNGVDAVAAALLQDTRAIEAGVHAYAAYQGRKTGSGYAPLSTFRLNETGDLVGRLEMPIAVGLIGGAVETNRAVKAFIEILGVKSARELAEVCAAVGLAQNISALRMLASFGITSGQASFGVDMKKRAALLRPKTDA